MDAILEYENQMFLDAFTDDGLLITARGLGIERIFSQFLKLYSDPENLVLVLNTNPQEEDFFIEKLENSGTQPLPKAITNEYSASERQSIYLEGGVLFVTSRILVVDFLTNRVPAHLITGILVYKAHRILESCQEAFILRLYRQNNKSGFIKAFSDSAQSFTSGFCHVERVMKSLFVRKLFLWPRFHASVVACLQKNKPEVIELELQLTPYMVACQTAILDLLDACIKELRRGNATLDTEEITVEHAITRNFDKIVRLHLDPVWHQLSHKTKQLIMDIKTLRLIILHLTQYDCVNFFNLVNSIKSNEKTFGQNSGWLFLDSADNLFVHSRERIFGPIKKNKKTKLEETEKSSENKNTSEPLLEECPKWHALREILDEINEENKNAEPQLGPGQVLVAAEDDRTCNQIREYLCEGGRTLLTRLYNKSLGIKSGTILDQQQKPMGRGKGKGQGKSSSKVKNNAAELTLTQMVDKKGSDVDADNLNQKSDLKLEDLKTTSTDAYYEVIQSPVTVLHPLHGSSDPFSLIRTLNEVQPRFVVLYDADMVFVRQLEIFKASHPGKPLRVYFMMYKGSTEEQCYLTTIKKKKVPTATLR